MTHDSKYLGFDPALVGTPLASYRTSSRGELPRGVERVTEGGEEGSGGGQCQPEYNMYSAKWFYDNWIRCEKG